MILFFNMHTNPRPLISNFQLIYRSTAFNSHLYQLEPRSLLERAKSEISQTMFQAIRIKLSECTFDSLSQYDELLNFLRKSHHRGHLQKIESELALHFNINQNITHCIWLATLAHRNHNYRLALLNLESAWFENLLDLDLNQLETILRFQTKIVGLPFQVVTANETLRFLSKLYHPHEKVALQIYSCLLMLKEMHPIIEGDQIYQQLLKELETSTKYIKKSSLLKNYGFFMQSNEFNFSDLITSLKAERFLTVKQFQIYLQLTKSCLKNGYQVEQLADAIDRFTLLKPIGAPYSLNLQLNLLKQLVTSNCQIDYQADQMHLMDYEYLLELNQLSENYENKNYIYKFAITNLPNRKLFPDDIKYFLNIKKLTQNDKMLYLKFQKYLRHYCFIY